MTGPSAGMYSLPVKSKPIISEMPGRRIIFETVRQALSSCRQLTSVTSCLPSVPSAACPQLPAQPGRIIRMAPDFEAPVAWSLVIPVKVLAQAKSRLTGLTDERRSRLALAMAADTVAAAIAADSVAVVLVVTDDPEVGEATAELGAIVLADEPAAGLNEALRHGAAS